jgi:endoglucanase
MACGADVRSAEETASADQSALACGSEFYTPPASTDAIRQVKKLRRAMDWDGAANISALVSVPHAVWFTGGSASEVKEQVRITMARAHSQHATPILVAYNVPFRDCTQYSSGGATDTAAYAEWIDGFAEGIGRSHAIVILEPDGLGIIPYNTNIDGSSDWCKPTVTDSTGNVIPAPGASPDERYAQLNHAVDSLRARAPHALIYLDGTHSAWLGVGEISHRLVKAGIQRARGLFLNASNYQPTPQLEKYGAWISKCIYYANNTADGGWRAGHYEHCASQYYPATQSDFGTWTLTDQWYTDHVDTSANPPATKDLPHFVIDTSRNGRGPLDSSVYAAAPYNQGETVISGLQSGNWCNPVGAGAGLRPTSRTGVTLLDAFVWIKVPGESDGSCDIAGGARAWDFAAYNPWGLDSSAQSHFDPLWGMVDPAAGLWFAEQALQLAERALPPLF